MNLFVLHALPRAAAAMHCNKHVPKMIVEAAQLRSNTHHFLGSQWAAGGDGSSVVRLYKQYGSPNMRLAPMIWLQESLSNYRWACEMGLALCDVYTKRYGKRHKSQDVLAWLSAHEPADVLVDKGLTPFRPAVPEQYIVVTGEVIDPIESYRMYYVCEKNYFAKWPEGEVPDWYTAGLTKWAAVMLANRKDAADKSGSKTGKKMKMRRAEDQTSAVAADAGGAFRDVVGAGEHTTVASESKSGVDDRQLRSRGAQLSSEALYLPLRKRRRTSSPGGSTTPTTTSATTPTTAGHPSVVVLHTPHRMDSPGATTNGPKLRRRAAHARRMEDNDTGHASTRASRPRVTREKRAT
eukprot:Opistho-2@61555